MSLWTSTSKLPPVFGALASSAAHAGRASSKVSSSTHAGMRFIMGPPGRWFRSVVQPRYRGPVAWSRRLFLFLRLAEQQLGEVVQVALPHLEIVRAAGDDA